MAAIPADTIVSKKFERIAFVITVLPRSYNFVSKRLMLDVVGCVCFHQDYGLLMTVLFYKAFVCVLTGSVFFRCSVTWYQGVDTTPFTIQLLAGTHNTRADTS